MGLQGSVKAFSLDELLDFLTASGHRGTLQVFHKDHRKTLYLYQSGLYFERSHWSFRLGDVLVRRGEITKGQVEEALTLQKAGGNRVGDLLIQLGHTTEEKILAARRYQVEEEVYQLFAWEDAFFEFESDRLPDGFEDRLADPEEFRFEVRSVLMEAARRRDEWQRIREVLPSDKRIYVLTGDDPEAERAAVRHVLEEAGASGVEPEEAFDQRVNLGELPHRLGLSPFEAKAAVSKLIELGAVRKLRRQELEQGFRAALDEDLGLALKLYEAALESPEFEGRGRFLDRILFGSDPFKGAVAEAPLAFSARLKGKRAFEVLMALFRQGIACEFTAKEEGRELRLGISKNSLVWRTPEGWEPPNIVQHLLSRSPVAEADLSRVREMQRQTKRSLKHILVGGGYVTMDNWFRAQKDAVLNEMFDILLLKRPFVEVRTGEYRPSGEPGVDVDVPLLPWLHKEVMADIREWERVLAAIPSMRAFVRLTEKGAKELKGEDDVYARFDGHRSLIEVVRSQPKSPQEFLGEVYQRLQAGRLELLGADDYRALLEAALAADQRAEAIDYCLAAIDCGLEAREFHDRLTELQALETEIAAQTIRPTLRGDLASFSLAEVLQSFHLGKRSGTLSVTVPGDVAAQTRRIYFDGGDVYLLAGDMDQQLSEDDLLETELVAAGMVTEDQLASAAAQQMKDEVYEIFLWEGAQFEFAADHLPPEFYSSSRHRKIRLRTGEFLLEAVRRAAQWEEVRRLLPADDVVLCFESNQAKVKAVTEKGSEDLLLLVDGRHPVADLVRISGVRRFKALTLLAQLIDEGLLREVDVDAEMQAEESAIVSVDLPTSGVIEDGFVGQLQFVGTLQDMASAALTGVLRLTDGRRSKELVLIDGVPYRTNPFRTGSDAPPDVEESSLDAARDVSECFSWSGARFELLVGVLTPRLEDPDERAPLALDPDVFFDAFAEAGERWGLVGEVIPRERVLSYRDDAARERAAEAAPVPDLIDLVDGSRTAEDIARASGRRYASMSWLAGLFEEGLLEASDPIEEMSEEEWDFSL